MDIRKEEPSQICVHSLISLLINWMGSRNFWTSTPLDTEDEAENGGRESARSLTASHVIACSSSLLHTLENNACNSSVSLVPFMAFLTLSLPLAAPLSQLCLVAPLSWDDCSQGLLLCIWLCIFFKHLPTLLSKSLLCIMSNTRNPYSISSTLKKKQVYNNLISILSQHYCCAEL